jgi:putative spermidine/putrescine transport system permease protein
MSLSTSAFLEFPPPGYSWHWYSVFFADPSWRDAMILSAKVGIGAMVLSVTVGTASAYGLARGRVRGAAVVEGLFMLPLVIPSVVFAVGAYFVGLALGLIGSVWLLIVAHATLALPFVVLYVTASIRTTDYRLELVARSLGASPLTAFREVTLPLISPAIIAAGLITLILSLDETVVALFLTADTAPTLPVKVYNSIRYQLDPLVPVAAMVVIGVSILIGAVYLASRWLVSMQRRTLRGASTRDRALRPART